MKAVFITLSPNKKQMSHKIGVCVYISVPFAFAEVAAGEVQETLVAKKKDDVVGEFSIDTSF